VIPQSQSPSQQQCGRHRRSQCDTHISFVHSLFIVLHEFLAGSVVDAKGKLGLASTGLAIACADLSGRVLAELARLLVDGIEALGAIALVGLADATLCQGGVVDLVDLDALAAVQTHMFPAVADIDLVLALDAKVVAGTDAVLPISVVRCVELEVVELWSEFAVQGDVLEAFSALATVVALEGAGWFFDGFLTVGADLAQRAGEALWTLASEVSIAPVFVSIGVEGVSQTRGATSRVAMWMRWCACAHVWYMRIWMKIWRVNQCMEQ